MSYSVEVATSFSRSAKRLAEKYPAKKKDRKGLVDTLEQTPLVGTPLGPWVHKVRLAISSKGKGKSGGARVITFIQVQHEIVSLLAIYDKSATESVTDKQIAELIRRVKDR